MIGKMDKNKKRKIWKSSFGKVMAIVIVGLFLGSGFGVIGMEHSGMADGKTIIDGNNSNDGESDLYLYSHLATREEINRMKERVGIYDPNKNYNVIYDGYGTGFAPPTEEEWNAMVGNIRIVNPTPGNSSFPSVGASRDLSADPCFPQVRSQGGQGSCAAWASTYYAAGYIQASGNGWTEASIGNNSQLLSPAFTYNKCNGGYDGGSWMYTNGYVMETVGVSIWSKMPYNDLDPVSWGDENAWRDAPSYRINETYYLGTPVGYTDVSTVKGLLDSGLPVTFALNASSYYYWGSDYVLNSGNMLPGVNHGNCIVGYNDSKTDVESGETGAFKVVNSWGSGFGDNGYYWMTYDAFMGGNIVAVTWFDDLYITDSPSLLSTWELNPQCDRQASVELGVGSHASPLDTRTPWWEGGSHGYPNFMCLDITEFYDEWSGGTSGFYLDIGDTGTDGTITSFKVEYYEGGYNPGLPTQTSSESPDVPQTTPGYVTVSFSSPPPSIVYVDDNFDASTPGWQYDHFANIQNGINAVTDSGSVHVYNGTYYENVVISKSINLTGESRDNTVIDGGGIGDVVYTGIDWVNISNFTIQNGGQEGIYLVNADNGSITNCDVSFNGDVGILLNHSNYCSIESNVIHNNTYDGILLEYSNYTDITNNDAYWNGVGNNGEGILLMYSHYCYIANNTAHDNGEDGIILEPDSSYNNVFNNTCYGNADCGILISNSSNENFVYDNNVYDNTYDGILVETSSGNDVIKNNIHDNGQEGMYLFSSSDTVIKNNTFEQNTGYGIYLTSSSTNVIYNNYFNNTNNAWDNGNNKWNITKTAGTNIIGGPYLGGNYWSNYNGYDINGDGLGDTLLPCDSNGNILSGGDMHPLVSPNYAPTANFTHSPTSPTTDDTITFTDTSTDADGTIVDWLWNFGDGNVSKAGTALQFDGTNDYIDCGNDASLDITDTITVEMWVKPSAVVNAHGIALVKGGSFQLR
ncbi:MAG: NosD domain-containing protein, partial [Candidatus Thermoplasmatota archaeon]|nr:NosD domain-containing protein [Candidatus Thermoplasmatota archaeon]